MRPDLKFQIWVRFGSDKHSHRVPLRIKNRLSVPLKSSKLYVVSASEQEVHRIRKSLEEEEQIDRRNLLLSSSETHSSATENLEAGLSVQRFLAVAGQGLDVFAFSWASQFVQGILSEMAIFTDHASAL